MVLIMVSIQGLSVDEIQTALKNVNTVFSGNVIFNRFDIIPMRYGYKYEITLKVISSSGCGARTGFTGRKMINACWHVYGLFFDECFALNPSCTIKQCGMQVTPSNNWTDKNIGSRVKPLMYSDACACNDNPELIHKIFVRQSEIR